MYIAKRESSNQLFLLSLFPLSKWLHNFVVYLSIDLRGRTRNNFLRFVLDVVSRNR